MKAAEELVKALAAMETNKDEMNAKDRRTEKRKAEAIAKEKSGCEDASELLQWYETQPKSKEGSSSGKGPNKEAGKLSKKDKAKLDTANSLMKDLGTIEKSETLNAKERRSAKRKAEAIASEKVDCSVPELLDWYEQNKTKLPISNNDKKRLKPNEENEGPNKKHTPYILFVGQLSYDTTAKGLFDHFQKELGKTVVTSKTVSIRLLTDKARKNRSKGMAFVEVKDPELMYECLKLHHTYLDGRRMNLERSAGGGKNSDGRKDKIKQYRKEQEEYMSQTVEKILTEKYNSGDIEKGELDDGVVALMKRRSAAVVEAALSEYVEERVKEMDNPSAYLTTMVCRITEDGIENKKIENKKSRGGGRGGHSKNNNSKGPNKKGGSTDKQYESKNGAIGNSFTKSSELAKAGVDMSISLSSSSKGDFSKIFPSMSRGRGRGGYMGGR